MQFKELLNLSFSLCHTLYIHIETDLLNHKSTLFSKILTWVKVFAQKYHGGAVVQGTSFRMMISISNILW